MSKCISRHGEYSEHTPSADDEFTCGLCWVVDEEAMRSALTEARERESRLREAVERLADEWDEKVRDRRHRRDRIPRGSSLSINQERDRSEWQGELRAYNHAAERIRAVLADVPPAVQGDTGRGEATTGIHFESWCDDCEETIETTSEAEVDAFNAKHEHAGDAPPDEQEAGEVRCGWCEKAATGVRTEGHMIVGPACGEHRAPSGSDDTKGGAAGE